MRQEGKEGQELEIIFVGLSIALKNTLGLMDDIGDHFDCAVNEQVGPSFSLPLPPPPSPSPSPSPSAANYQVPNL
jgi:hypothetical protein